MKSIWIINHYATTEVNNKGGRPYCLSKYLMQSGYDVKVFCASTLHRTGNQLIEIDNGLFKEVVPESQVPHVYVKARSYKGNGKQRILNMLDFYRNVKEVAEIYIEKEGVPDVIIGSSVHPLACVAAIKIANKHHTKSITEIRDLWPETLVAYGIVSSKNPIVLCLREVEKWIYKKPDAIIFTMEGGYDYIIERKWEKKVPKEKVYCINNGVDLEIFDYNREHFTISDDDLNDTDTYKVVYAGSIRKANNLDKLLDVAKKIRNTRVRILIWGDGTEIDRLKERTINEKIGNTIFKGRVDKEYIPFITSKADLNIAHGENSPVFRFGLSLNKMFDYLAAGKPILTDFHSPYNPTVQCGAGIEVESTTAEGIAKEIDEMTTIRAEQNELMCHNARLGAEKYDFKELTQQLIEIILKISNKTSIH